MRKLIFASLVLLLTACDKESSSYGMPEGVYTASSELGQISVDVSAGKCSSVALMSDGSRYVWNDLKTTGSYPDYTYSREGFSLRARYLNSDSFTGSMSGGLGRIDEGPNLSNSFSLTLEGLVQIFSKSN